MILHCLGGTVSVVREAIVVARKRHHPKKAMMEIHQRDD